MTTPLLLIAWLLLADPHPPEHVQRLVEALASEDRDLASISQNRAMTSSPGLAAAHALAKLGPQAVGPLARLLRHEMAEPHPRGGSCIADRAQGPGTERAANGSRGSP